MFTKLKTLTIKQKLLIFIFVILSIGINIFIFVESSMQGSISYEQSHEISSVISNVINVTNDTCFEYSIRKLIGHFGLFFLDGLLLSLTTCIVLKYLNLGLTFVRGMILIFIGFVLSTCSELIQIGVSGRYFYVGDILIDFLGFAISSCLIFYLHYLIIEYKKE